MVRAESEGGDELKSCEILAVQYALRWRGAIPGVSCRCRFAVAYAPQSSAGRVSVLGHVVCTSLCLAALAYIAQNLAERSWRGHRGRDTEGRNRPSRGCVDAGRFLQLRDAHVFCHFGLRRPCFGCMKRWDIGSLEHLVSALEVEERFGHGGISVASRKMLRDGISLA